MSKPTEPDAVERARRFFFNLKARPVTMAIEDILADHAAAEVERELAAYRERLRAEVQAMPFRDVVSRDNGNLEFINRADVLELI